MRSAMPAEGKSALRLVPEGLVPEGLDSALACCDGHRGVGRSRKDSNNVISELFGVGLQEYGPGWKGLLSVQRLRALVVFGSCARREAVRM